MAGHCQPLPLLAIAVAMCITLRLHPLSAFVSRTCYTQRSFMTSTLCVLWNHMYVHKHGAVRHATSATLICHSCNESHMLLQVSFQFYLPCFSWSCHTCSAHGTRFGVLVWLSRVIFVFFSPVGIDSLFLCCHHCTSISVAHVLSSARRLTRMLGPFILFVIAKRVL